MCVQLKDLYGNEIEQENVFLELVEIVLQIFQQSKELMAAVCNKPINYFIFRF